MNRVPSLGRRFSGADVATYDQQAKTPLPFQVGKSKLFIVTMNISRLNHRLCSVENCLNKVRCKDLCKRHYFRKRKTGNLFLQPPRNISLKEKLLFSRKIDPITNCWEWTRGLRKDGYGKVHFKFDNKERTLGVHRASAHVFKDFDLFSEKQVLHHCDNRKCFNPDHLWIGTNAENKEDCVRKGRHSRGEAQGHSKLTNSQILEIRKEKLNGETTVNLSKKYKVYQSHISSICRRKSWRHI